MRQKEYSLKELYERRQKNISAIPDFWPTVLANGPEDFQNQIGPQDGEIIDSITSMRVERYQIKSGAEGEPRSMRFTFTFDTSKNKFFEDSTVTKDFEFVGRENGPGGLVSRPVNFKWTRAGKSAGLNKMLDLAEQLWQAEQALVGDSKKGKNAIAIEQNEREGLWQYEKLREELDKEEDEPVQTSFLDWFGYRGAVAASDEAKATNGDAEESDEEDEDDEDDDGLLEVEIFPAGEDVANALAEELWPDVMDFYIQAQAEDDLDLDLEGESDDEDAPQLVEAADFEGFDEDEKPPSKKQRTS